MNRSFYYITLVSGLMLSGRLTGQILTGAGSSTNDNSKVIIAAGTSEFRYSEISYFGPDADWEINGTLEIWSKEIWIAPTARFSGSGKIIIHDPSENPFYTDMEAGPTLVDGNNGRFIGVDIVHENPYNIVLRDLDDPGYGTANPDGAQAAQLNIAKSFSFAVNNGDVLLNGNNLAIDITGVLVGYGASRMVVTGNSIDGHLIKAYENSSTFVFPIGIAEGDYTPATLTPESTSVLHVSVQNYAAGGIALPDPETGMDRIWHIFSDDGISTDYTLQHNSITNGTAYVDEDAEIVQYAGSGNWIGDLTVINAESVHSRSDIMTIAGATEDGTWFTKLSTEDLVPPQAENDRATTTAGKPVNILVLENDQPGSSPIVVSTVDIVMPPTSGTAIVNEDGSITYTPDINFTGEVTLRYEVKDENGQISVAEVTIVVEPEPLFIPNVFTPNGDGEHDTFVITGRQNFEVVDLTIFNRWGNEVYRNNDYKDTWDGNGLNEGTYYYLIILKKDGEEKAAYKGWVLLKR